MFKKIFRVIKKIIFKVFGKARWWLVIFAISGILLSISTMTAAIFPYTNGIKTWEGDFVREYSPREMDEVSINDKGKAVLVSEEFNLGIGSVFNIDSNGKSYSNIRDITTSLSKNETINPYNFVITDENEIYAVSSDMLNESLIFTKDTIVKISDEYKYVQDVCSFDYDTSQRQRYSRLSDLHYYNGKVTFASVEEDGVYLYSLDTVSQALSESKFYPTDENGTYTACVIPVDDSFIFLRSDGNVYRTGFDEPLGDSIYKFDIKIGEECDNPYFNRAVLVDGKLYVTDTQGDGSVYLLEDGALEKVFNIHDVEGKDDSWIVNLEAYHPEGSSEETLVVCLFDGFLTYSDGNLLEKNVVIKINPTITMWIEKLLENLISIAFIALFINLIIRKKTLLYKQLILTLPIFIAITITCAVKLYIYSDSKMGDDLADDLNVVCQLGKDEFEGYDFSGLLKVDENTGASYREMTKVFEKMGSGTRRWSDKYVFAVMYQNDMNEVALLGADDTLYMPLQFQSTGKVSDTDEVYVDNQMLSMFEESNRDSDMSAFGKIKDKDNTGRFYLVVSADTGYIFSERKDILFKVFIYGFLIISVLITLIVVSMMNTLRVIRKATKTVKEISDGNLSSRINYKSKDELGEICSEVNEMGQSLETLFNEKDETEKFYYKFVPEKFRELLGKESFTDLNLGDAKSCELTVLFCDIRSFSINSEMMTAKENFSFVNVIYGKMGPIVRKNNGFVDKYIGDAVMALFENADDAIRCGIEMYQEVALDIRTAEELNISDINIGIGIHTGMAMVGIVGESERLSGTVISDTVNLSSRLESLTKQYKTAMLISKDTVDRLSDAEALDLRYLGMVQVAGVNEVKPVYEVLDCLPEEAHENRAANKDDFREALRLFQLGRRKDAVKALEDIESAGKNDYVSDMYLKYISEMSDDDKGNVFRFVRK